MTISSRSAPTFSVCSIFNGMAVLLFILTSAKLLIISLGTPVFGYSNNWDFIRQSSCTGLWLSVPGVEKHAGSIQYVSGQLINDGERIAALCQLSSDTLLTFIVASIHPADAVVPFSHISLARVLLLLMLTGAVLASTSERRHRNLIFLSFFLVFGDIKNLLYLNTLYLEFAVLTGLYLTAILFILLNSSPITDNWPCRKICQVCLFILSVLWLGMSKEQYLPYAIALCLVCIVLALSRRRLWITAPLIAVVFMMPALYYSINKPTEGIHVSINFANKANTYFGAVLPEAEDLAEAMQILRIPQKCAPLVGKNWYAADVNWSEACPEALQVQRLRLLPLFAHQPETFSRPLMQALEGIRPFIDPLYSISEVPGETRGVRYQLLTVLSLSDYLELPDTDLFIKLVIGAGMLGFFVSLSLLCPRFSARNGSLKTSILLLAVGSWMLMYALFSTVFGDGYIEISRHAVAFQPGCSFFLIGCLNLLDYLRQRRSEKGGHYD